MSKRIINPSQQIDAQHLRRLWADALAEDGADRDVTSLVAVDDRTQGVARVNACRPGVFAGRVLLDVLVELYSDHLRIETFVADGEAVQPGTGIAIFRGSMRLLLGIERTLLNFLQRLCGVATLTGQFVGAAAGTSARIYDTRKTIPGWRQLDKYAVRCGGGYNHRLGLHDAVLIKDNHLAGVPLSDWTAHASVIVAHTAALEPRPAFIEFEVDTLDQLDELLKVRGIDVILLDNFTPAQMGEAVARRDRAGLGGQLALEASGGATLEGIGPIAATGVDRIAVGALTHSAVALDIGMEIEPLPAVD